MTTPLHERLLSALAAAAVLALFGYMLMVGLSFARPPFHEETLALLNLRTPPPPPVPPRPPAPQSRPSRAAGNTKSGAAPAKVIAVAPPSRIELLSAPPAPILPQTVLAAASGSGTAGQGGAGQGSGAGDGAGGTDGDGDGDAPPRLIRGHLEFSDLPAALRASGVGRTVSVRYDIEADGTVSACIPIASSGDAELDQRTCQLIRQRFRFDPSRDRRGRPVRATIEEEHSWDIDKAADEDRASR